MELRVSRLNHTWLIDVDGVVLEHNGHLRGEDRLLPGVRAFWAAIPPADTVVVLSARSPALEAATRAVLAAYGLRVDRALFGLPNGERILVNDRKPSGLPTAIAVNLPRDEGLGALAVEVDDRL